MSYFNHFAKSKPTKIGDLLHSKEITNEFSIINNFISDKNIEILEVGPGKGDLAKMFLKSGYKNYDIVEPNKIMRDDLTKAGIRKSENYLVPPFKEKDNFYDLVIASDIFEHLNDSKESQLFISEIKRILKKEGLVFILSPDYLDWKEDFFNCDFSHSNPTTLRRTKQLFYNNQIKPIYETYSYSCFNGLLGCFLNKFIKAITFFQKGNFADSKIYKLKLTFLRRFIIIGKRL